MDATSLYPDGYHPVRVNRTQDLSKLAKHYTRTQRPVKYYLTDFGLSRQYKPEDRPPREPPIRGADKSVPEFKDSDDPCDPFPTDVYYLGNMIRETFTEVSIFLGYRRPNCLQRLSSHLGRRILEQASRAGVPQTLGGGYGLP